MAQNYQIEAASAPQAFLRFPVGNSLATEMTRPAFRYRNESICMWRELDSSRHACTLGFSSRQCVWRAWLAETLHAIQETELTVCRPIHHDGRSLLLGGSGKFCLPSTDLQ